MQSPLGTFLDDLVQSHGYGVEDVSIRRDSAGCMLPNICLLSNEGDRAGDTEEKIGPLKSPSSCVLTIAESVVGEVKKVTRWESVTSGGTTATSPVSSVVIRLRDPRTQRSSVRISKRRISSDSTLSLPQRKESMDSISSNDARESPKRNATFDKLTSGKQAKDAKAIARSILFDQI
jgi:hypothetical protein